MYGCYDSPSVLQAGELTTLVNLRKELLCLKIGSSSGDDDTTQDDKTTPVTDDYFQGYFAFALWGYIPREGGDKYKSSLIGTIVETG